MIHKHHSVGINYQVTISLMNGDHLRGSLTSFSSKNEDVVFIPADSNHASYPKAHMTTARNTVLHTNHLAHIAFLKQKTYPVPLLGSEEVQNLHLELIHGESLYIKTSPTLQREHGFYAFPVNETSTVGCFFVYHHAISTKNSSKLIGQMLVKAGHASEDAVQEALNIQQGLRQQRIGEILQQQQQRVEHEDIQSALRKQFDVRKKLGEILLESGLIDRHDLASALSSQQEESDKKLGQVLMEMGAITELELASTLAQKYRLPLIDLDSYDIESSAIHEVDVELVRKYQWLPIHSDDNTITMAIADPLATEAETVMQFHSNKRIQQVIATASKIKTHIERLLAGSDKDDWLWLETLEQDAMEQHSENEDISLHLSKAIDAPPIVRIVNKIILDAHQRQASDIHLLPQADELTLSYRINGELIRISGLDKWLQRRVVSRIKLLSNMDISETRMPQDGRLRARRGNICIDFRVSCMPSAYGESLVLRMLREHIPSFTEIGLRTKDAIALRHMIARPFGLILATGPTGSGKSTTLQALVREIIQAPIHVITAEDPIEAEIPGVNQIQVNPRIGLDFIRILRNILRHDPDVIMVGEMRDSETALIGIEAALTGHLILSSLHTNSAVDSIVRLLDLGIERYMLAPALLGIISQSLAKTLCSHCKKRAPTDDEMAGVLRNLLYMPLPPFYDKGGCSHCHQSGYSGRKMVYEFLAVNDNIRNAVNAGENMLQLQRLAIKEGMYSKALYALELAAGGIICRSELMRLLV